MSDEEQWEHDEQRAMETEITALREQVEKLTKSYDQCGRTVQEYGRTITQTELRLHEVATHCANVEQQLAALKLAREALQGIHPGNMTPMAEINWMEALAAIDALGEVK